MIKGQINNRIDIITPNDRIFIFHDLEHTLEGTVVERWPLHCTIIAPFYPEGELAIESLAACVKDELSQFNRISAAPDIRTYFGPNEDAPVQTLRSSAETKFAEQIKTRALRLVHTRISLGLRGIWGGGFTNRDWSYENYSAHISCHEDTVIEPFDINELSIGVTRDGVGKVIASVVMREN